jgi:hypothetical protein
MIKKRIQRKQTKFLKYLCCTMYIIEKRKCENEEYGGKKATKKDE